MIFSTKEEAAAHAAQRLKETISASLGENYRIPPEHIDENGFIAHSASGVEISSSEWGWSLWWDNIESIRDSFILTRISTRKVIPPIIWPTKKISATNMVFL